MIDQNADMEIECPLVPRCPRSLSAAAAAEQIQMTDDVGDVDTPRCKSGMQR